MTSIQHFEYDGNWQQYFSVERALAWVEAYRAAGGKMDEGAPLWQALRKGTRIDVARAGKARKSFTT